MLEVVQERGRIGFSLGHYQFYGQDKDGTCINMAKTNLFLHNLNRPFARFNDLNKFQQFMTLILQAGMRPGQTRTRLFYVSIPQSGLLPSDNNK